MRLDVRNMTQQQIADANNQWLAQNSQPFTGQPKRPMQSDMGAVGGMPLMPMLPMGVPPMGVPPMGFGPGINNFGAAPGIGNPMQDAFQRFLSAQGQGVGGTPPTPRDPFKMFDDGPMGIAGGGTGMPPMGRDPFRRSDEGIPLWMQLGQPNPNQPTGIAGGVGTPAMGDYSMYAPEYRPGGQPMDRQRQPGQVRSPEMQAYYAQDAANQKERSRRMQMLQGVQGAGQPQPSGGRGFDFSFDPTQPRISGGPVGFAGGGTGMPPIGQPMTQPPAGGLSYNDGFYNPANRTQQPMTQTPAPMAMKKGGFAVKPVWEKKRPKDLGKPKDLSAKKEKYAKARAKAAGRPYPNLIDNMAVARKKGK